MSTVRERETLQKLSLALAEFYRFPDERFYQQLIDGEWEGSIKRLFLQAGFTLEGELPLPEIYPDFPSLKQEFINCFMGTVATSAPPIASLYKVWTQDPSAQIVIAGQKGYLMGDGALHIKHLLHSFGLELPPEWSQKPDHIVILLELLAVFLEQLTSHEVEEYLADHFDWLTDFYQQLETVATHDFYLIITRLLMSVIEQVPEILAVSIQEREVF